MDVKIDDLIKRTLTVLEENNQPDEWHDENLEGLSISQLIEHYIPSTARMVVEQAPPKYITASDIKQLDQVIRWHEQVGYGSGSIDLPKDYCRLWAFQMSDWERPVYDTVDPTTDEYKLLRSRYSGISGTPQRPKCAIVQTIHGRELEFFTSRAGDHVYIRMANYLPVPTLADNTLHNIPENLIDILAVALALQVSRSMGEADAITVYSSQLSELLDIGGSEE